MVKAEVWQDLLRIGVQAPSGDNSQPWRFELHGDRLSIFSVPENDNPAYNLNQFGSLVAIGALLENISIASRHAGYDLSIELFPGDQDENLVAYVRISAMIASVEDELYGHIFSRCTNRKAYQDVGLTVEQKHELEKVSKAFTVGKVDFIFDRKLIKEMAGAVSVNERVVLENFPLHKYFFDHVRWSEEEELEKKNGLYLKTLEFDKPTNFFFKKLKNWKIMKAANKIGFAKLVSKTNAKIYAKSSALGMISVKNNDKKSHVEAGRMLQRIWLTAEKMGLSFQMVTGVLFFMQRVHAKQIADFFGHKHVKSIGNSHGSIKKVFEVGDITPILLFRVGVGGKPSGRSSRLPPVLRVVE